MPSNEENPQAKLDRLIAANNAARQFSSSTVMSAGSRWTDLEVSVSNCKIYPRETFEFD